MPRASVKRLRLTPPLPRSVGLGPVFFPAQRRSVQRAVEGHPGKIESNQVLVVQQGLVTEAGKNPVLHPLLKASVGRRGRTDARRAQRLPLAARTQREENPVQYLPVRHPLPMAAQRMRFRYVSRQMGR